VNLLNDVAQERWPVRVAFFRGPDGELIELLEDQTGYTCATLSLASLSTLVTTAIVTCLFASKWGLARIERAKPIVVQTFDLLVTAEQLLLRQPCRRSHAQSDAGASTSRNLGGPKLLCTGPHADVKTRAVGD
jgi:hypothetical protein